MISEELVANNNIENLWDALKSQIATAPIKLNEIKIVEKK